jgi:cell division protein FtsN
MKAHAADAFCIAVGTYADENEANGARNAVSEGTRLPSRVIAVNEGGATAYRVVVGSFQTRVSAERAASDLIRNGLVDEARVMTVAREATPDQ